MTTSYQKDTPILKKCYQMKELLCRLFGNWCQEQAVSTHRLPFIIRGLVEIQPNLCSPDDVETMDCFWDS